jgi:hypothetical protein
MDCSNRAVGLMKIDKVTRNSGKNLCSIAILSPLENPTLTALKLNPVHSVEKLVIVLLSCSKLKIVFMLLTITVFVEIFKQDLFFSKYPGLQIALRDISE